MREYPDVIAYARGFIGMPFSVSPSEPQELKIDDLAFAKNTLRFVLNTDKQSNKPSDDQIESLIKAYDRDRTLLRQFDFREKILYLAKSRFSFNGLIDNFKEFLYAQLSVNGAEISDMHLETMISVLNYLKYDTMPYIGDIYCKLLNQKERCSPEKRKVFINTLRQAKEPYLNNLVETIAYWCSKEDGYSVLLEVLWLFYGQNREIVDD